MRYWCEHFDLAGTSHALQRHHDDRDGLSNQRRLYCFFNRLFWRRLKKYQSSASLAIVRGIHRSPVDSPGKGPVSRKVFSFDDITMNWFNNNHWFLSKYYASSVISISTEIVNSHDTMSFCLGQNGRHFTHDIYRFIFANEKFCVLIKLSLKLIRNDTINNDTALVKIMARHRIDDKPLSEQMLTLFNNAYMLHQGGCVN